MKKWLKVSLISIVTLIIAFAIVFLVYVSDYSHADDIAIAVMSGENTITTKGNLTILEPSLPTDTAFIFYPGGKVEYNAYLPLLEKLREKGVLCILVKMPFNLAVFDSNAADKIFEQFPQIDNWYIGGHSLGGAMASNYFANHSDMADGLILLGAYIYGDISPEVTLTIYGSQDNVIDKSKVTYDENVYIIEGGNHAQFGNYGLQKGDGLAFITSDEQQNITVEKILAFIK